MCGKPVLPVPKVTELYLRVKPPGDASLPPALLLLLMLYRYAIFLQRCLCCCLIFCLHNVYLQSPEYRRMLFLSTKGAILPKTVVFRVYQHIAHMRKQRHNSKKPISQDRRYGKFLLYRKFIVRKKNFNRLIFRC